MSDRLSLKNFPHLKSIFEKYDQEVEVSKKKHGAKEDRPQQGIMNQIAKSEQTCKLKSIPAPPVGRD